MIGFNTTLTILNSWLVNFNFWWVIDTWLIFNVRLGEPIN